MKRSAGAAAEHSREQQQNGATLAGFTHEFHAEQAHPWLNMNIYIYALLFTLKATRIDVPVESRE